MTLTLKRANRVAHKIKPSKIDGFIERFAKAENRTPDTTLFRRVLYQLSYLGKNASMATALDSLWWPLTLP